MVNLVNQLNNFKKIPKSIIFTSSISIYGEKYNNNEYFESSKKKPLSPYAKTKKMAEDFLLQNYKEKSWILRLAPMYSSSFMLNINRRTKIGGFTYQIGDGSNMLSLCNIKNFELLIKSIIEGKIPSDIYNIADNKNYLFKDLIYINKNLFKFQVPTFLIKILLFIGKIIGSVFIIENTIKLLTNNIYNTQKISNYIKFPYFLNSLVLNKEKK